MNKSMKKILAAFMSITMAGALASCGDKKTSSDDTSAKKSTKPLNTNKTIGISMPSQELERWNSDAEYLKTQFEDAGYTVRLEFAQDDPSRQNSDIAKMINDGADLLLIAAVDGTTLSGTLESASEAGISVVAYDRLIMNSNAITYYVSFDNYAVGKLQGEFVRDQLRLDTSAGPFNVEFVAGDMGDNNARFFFEGAYDILKNDINNGKIVIPSGKTQFEQAATKDWATNNAKINMEATLGEFYSDGTKLDVALCANDSTALGVAQALETAYSGGNTPIITGQDGDIANLRNIVDGKQSMTVYKNVHEEATVAYEVCRSLLDNEIPTAKFAETLSNDFSIEVNYDSETYNNGVKYVQSYLLVPYVITKDNLHLLADTGLYQWDSSNKYIEAASK